MKSLKKWKSKKSKKIEKKTIRIIIKAKIQKISILKNQSSVIKNTKKLKKKVEKKPKNFKKIELIKIIIKNHIKILQKIKKNFNKKKSKEAE